MTSDQSGTYLRIAADMGKVLDNPTTGLRILPISGDGRTSWGPEDPLRPR